MAIPEFIVELRRQIGTAELWLIGVTAVVVRDDEVLLIRRSDTGQWSPVTGIVDPGEHPTEAAVREADEEAGVRIAITSLASVGVSGLVTYPNGERARYLDHTFLCHWVSGEPRPDEEETTDARWWPVDALPELSDEAGGRLDRALEMARTGDRETRLR